jgi:hypothetical protein
VKFLEALFYFDHFDVLQGAPDTRRRADVCTRRIYTYDECAQREVNEVDGVQ